MFSISSNYSLSLLPFPLFVNCFSFFTYTQFKVQFQPWTPLPAPPPQPQPGFGSAPQWFLGVPNLDHLIDRLNQIEDSVYFTTGEIEEKLDFFMHTFLGVDMNDD